MNGKIKGFLCKHGGVIVIMASQVYCGVVGYKTGIKVAKTCSEMTLAKYIAIKPEIATLIDEANELMENRKT